VGKDSGGGSQTAKTSSATTLPDWVTNQAQSNLARANTVADNLGQPYSGPRVANLNEGQQASIDELWNNRNMSQPGYAAAQSTLNGLQSFNPAMINAGQLSNTDLSPYMNPFTQNVIDASMKTMDQQRRQGINSIGDQAAGSKAFGGSRHGVAEGVLNAQSALGAGQLASGLNMQNFQQAQGAAGQDIASRFAADSANQQAGLQGAGVRMNAANSGAAVAGQGQESAMNGLMAALSGYGLRQQETQANMDANRQVYEEQRQYPVQQLSLLQSALGQTPYGSTTSGTQAQSLPGGDGTSKALGTAASVVGIAGSVAAMF
jgi:hypothetical protein